MKARKVVSLAVLGILTATLLAGCGSKAKDAETAAKPATEEATTEEVTTEDTTAEETTEAADTDSEKKDVVVIKGIADLVPHSELIEFVKPKLLEQGIDVELVATAADDTTNEKTEKGEIDFNFFQHEPYLESQNEANGFHLVNVGDIHVEPITAYSDKYKTKEEIPDKAVVAIPNDGTNEYRALRILEQNGFIKLNEETASTLTASLADISEYVKPIEIVEIDSRQIIPTKDDYDFFITNTNKALEAKITSARLFSEGSDSPYANIIVTREDNKDNPAILALVKELQSDDTKKFIEEKYNGAVIPAKLD